MAKLLCNKTSIMITLHSNHMLQTFCYGQQLPSKIKALLELNKKDDKQPVACNKIIINHLGQSLRYKIRNQNQLPSLLMPMNYSENHA